MTTQIQNRSERKTKRGRPPHTNAHETRLKLLLSAAQEFSRSEYSEVSLEAIAKNVGLTSTAIYNHFSSKDDLFFATIVHLMQTNLAAIEAEIQPQTGWHSQLRAVLHVIKRNQTGWFRFPLLISAAQLKNRQKPQQFEEILKLREVYVSHFVAIVEGGVAAGELPGSVAIKPTAELLMAFVFNGLGAAMSHRNDEDEIAQLFDGFEAILGLKPR